MANRSERSLDEDSGRGRTTVGRGLEDAAAAILLMAVSGIEPPIFWGPLGHAKQHLRRLRQGDHNPII